MIPIFLIGAILGIFIVREFAFTSVEELAYRIFWEGEKGQKTFTSDDILQSSAFLKLVLGSLIFGTVSMIFSGMIIFLVRASRNIESVAINTHSMAHADQQACMPEPPSPGVTASVPVIDTGGDSLTKPPSPPVENTMDQECRLEQNLILRRSPKMLAFGAIAVLVAAIYATFHFTGSRQRLEMKRPPVPDASTIVSNSLANEITPNVSENSPKQASFSVLPDINAQAATIEAPSTVTNSGPTSAVETIMELRQAAEQGDAKSQAILGFNYLMGKGVPNNPVEAVKWLRKAADQGQAIAQLNLGSCYSSGIGVPIDKKESFKWFLKAAEQGDTEAQQCLWQCYLKGDGVPKDDAEALKWIERAADQGYAIAQFQLGSCYATATGVPKNDNEAIKWWRKAAEQGHAQAQTNLGSCYGKGMGVPKDADESAKWYLKAANSGHAQAQVLLGGCYASGEGVTKDVSEAVNWYRKAAEQGYAEAQFHLGLCYATGAGTPGDIIEAIKWWRKAADQGYGQAQANLGACYANGFGIPIDVTEALKWYRMAADQGLPGPQYTLGSYYLRGEGVPKDYVMAYMWFNLSASTGDAEPTKARDALATEMVPEQIKEAQRLSREWRPGMGVTGENRLQPQPEVEQEKQRLTAEEKLLTAIFSEMYFARHAGGDGMTNLLTKYGISRKGVRIPHDATAEQSKERLRNLSRDLLQLAETNQQAAAVAKKFKLSKDARKPERKTSSPGSLRDRTKQFDDL